MTGRACVAVAQSNQLLWRIVLPESFVKDQIEMLCESSTNADGPGTLINRVCIRQIKPLRCLLRDDFAYFAMVFHKPFTKVV